MLIGYKSARPFRTTQRAGPDTEAPVERATQCGLGLIANVGGDLGQRVGRMCDSVLGDPEPYLCQEGLRRHTADATEGTDQGRTRERADGSHPAQLFTSVGWAERHSSPKRQREGALVPVERAWQIANHTYAFSRGLGVVELMIGVMTLAGLVSRRVGMVGAVLAFATPFVTLSFLVTTPEAWVTALGDAQHGFPYLSGAGRLVIKDVCILAGGWLVMVDTARGLLAERKTTQPSRWRLGRENMGALGR